MIKSETWEWSRKDLENSKNKGGHSIGGFIVQDILATEPKIEFNKIRCLGISDWDMASFPEELRSTVQKFEKDLNDSTIHIIILNVNDVESATNENTNKMVTTIKEYVYEEITKFVGYETRLAFISPHNEIAKQFLSSYKEEGD